MFYVSEKNEYNIYINTTEISYNFSLFISDIYSTNLIGKVFDISDLFILE